VANPFRSAFLLAALLATAGCHRPDSVLLVEVGGDETWPVTQLSATVIIGTTARMFFVPPTPTTIQLPSSFAVDLSRDVTGPVTVLVDALDANSLVLGSGTTVQEHINVGDDTIITVTLMAPAALAAPAGDAGVGTP
jgi:hypothetical protein